MEKAKLIREYNEVQKMLKNHQDCLKVGAKLPKTTKPDGINKYSPTNKIRLNPNIYPSKVVEKKNMIYVNPKKLGSSNIQKDASTDKITSIQVNPHSIQVNPHSIQVNPNFLLPEHKSESKYSSTVYINPKFGNSNSLHSHKTSSVLHVQKGSSLEKEKFAKFSNSLTKINSLPLQLIPKQGPISKRKSNSQTAKVGQTHIANNSHRIYVNPEFSPVTHSQNKSFASIPQAKNTLLISQNNLDTANRSLETKNHISTTELPKETMPKKGKIYINKNKVTSFSDVAKQRKPTGNFCHGKQIFFNPKFEKESNSPNDATLFKHNSIILKQDTGESLKSVERNTKKSTKSTNLIKEMSTIPDQSVQYKYQVKEVFPKRTRTLSTCLVPIGTKKLIRRRKSSVGLGTSCKTDLNLPLFVSKNKVIRKTQQKRVANNSAVVRAKIKQVVRKTLQCLTPDKVNKLRKSLKNVPKNRVISKIGLQSEQSVKLIRKNTISQISQPVLGFVKAKSNIIHIRKMLLQKQQIKNNILLSRYSKINVPEVKCTGGQGQNHNRYVYKNKDLLNKKSIQTNVTDLCQKNLTSCLESSNSLTERAKFIRSKYKIMRKRSNFSENKLRSYKGIRQSSGRPSVNHSSSKWTVSKPGKFIKRKVLSIVNISGIFYHCSRTTLTRNKLPNRRALQGQRKASLLHIQGQRFQLENNGQTLTCLDKEPKRKRIDIGGVTYISSSSGNSLTKTNYHTARSILAQAKLKRISLLNRKLRKNNEPCPIFHRFGHCSGKERGTCVRQHDPKYVAVCKKFVQGACEDASCRLSHMLSCHNMPTCQHYLAGHCGRDHCPYLHIKVSDNAPICQDFLKGYCSAGDQCSKRHFMLCPSFEKGVCSRGKYCPYPHPKSKTNSTLKLKGKFKYLKTSTQPQEGQTKDGMVSNVNVRYFEDENLKKENQIDLLEDTIHLEETCAGEDSDEGSCPLKNRPKLGRLPSFIPLDMTDSELLE